MRLTPIWMTSLRYRGWGIRMVPWDRRLRRISIYEIQFEIFGISYKISMLQQLTSQHWRLLFAFNKSKLYGGKKENNNPSRIPNILKCLLPFYEIHMPLFSLISHKAFICTSKRHQKTGSVHGKTPVQKI